MRLERASISLKRAANLCYRPPDDTPDLTFNRIKEAEMPTDLEELKRKLLEDDEEFRRLATKHHDLDERLHNYADRQYLTQPEQVEELTLKKQKLYLKDQMEFLLRKHGTDGVHARS